MDDDWSTVPDASESKAGMTLPSGDDYEWSAIFTAEPVSNDVWETLFGDYVQTYQAILTVPARRRTFWGWLTRKPRHLERRIVIPNARMTVKEAEK